ncbi:MAG: TetR/AcrR family transcriptional regulator [bacterium]|nr:TetR/AcrR family transcriptional regulator [bacterium]
MSELFEPGSTKEKLFIAGVKVFAQKGYKEATVRDICKLADSSNINSINYYFGSKEKLYKMILELMFADMDQRIEEEKPVVSPMDDLRMHIRIACELMFSGHEMSSDFYAIYVSELSHPSPYFGELVDKYTGPQMKAFMEVIRQILGPHATEDQVRDSGLSVGGQITYYTFVWPILSRVFPGHPGMPAYREQIIDHITRFTIGGLEAVKKHIEEGGR